MMPKMSPAISRSKPRAAVASDAERCPASRSTFVALTKEKRAPRAPAVFKSSSRASNAARRAADTRSAKPPPVASGVFTFKEIFSSSFSFAESQVQRLQALDCRRGAPEAVEREVQFHAIGNRDEEVADRAWREALLEEVGKRVEVPLALRHLLAVHEQVLGV